MEKRTQSFIFGRATAFLAATGLAFAALTASGDTPDWTRYRAHLSVAFTG